MHYDETNVARRIALSDEKAFKWAYDNYAPMLFALAYKILEDSEEARGAVQAVFVKLWEEREDLHVSRSLRNYLYTCTKHYVLNRVRRLDNERRHSVLIALQTTPFELSPEEELSKKEDEVRLRGAMAALPPQQSHVLSLKMEGLSNDEIARKMGISVPTVKFHYFQLIRSLRHKLK